MKRKKLFTLKTKRSIGSILLTLILLVSFNFTSISFLAGVIRNRVIAYKSSTTQSYYANTEIATETNISAGNYPSSLEQYFKGSSNNFNIEAYYNQRYSDLFAQKVDEFLRKFTSTGEGEFSTLKYGELYEKFLQSVNFNSLGEYYEANKDRTPFAEYNDFRDYFENFVTTSHEFTIASQEEGESQTYVLHKAIDLSTTAPLFEKYYEPFIYVSLANYLTGDNSGNVDTEHNDGLADADADVYTCNQYQRVKKVIDTEIEETVAIYSYDGNQNNYVAGIVANDAPSSMYYYYRDNTYEQVKVPSVSYESGTFYRDTQNKEPYTHIRYYYFGGTKQQLENSLTGKYKTEFDNIKDYITEEKESDLQSRPIYYRRVLEGEEGYLGDNYPIYKQYRSVPYVTTNSQYDIYVVMDENIDDSMKATLDSLYYFHTITMEELKEDQFEKDPNTGDILDGEMKGETQKEYKLNENRFYVQIPYSDPNSENTSWGDYWYTHLFGYVSSGSDIYYANFLEKILTDTFKQSKVYLRLREDTSKIVYINENDMSLEEFKTANPDYSHINDVRAVAINSSNQDDYYEVDSNNFSSYKTNLNSNIKLYFLKEKVYYQTLDTTSDDIYEKDGENFKYETTPTPNISYETQDIPNEKFEKFANNNDFNQVYILTSSEDYNINTRKDITVAETSNLQAKLVTQEIIDANRNLYVKVPEYLASQITVSDAGEDETFTFYYKHQTTERNKIYIVDSTEDAKSNEVYKNLYYSVINDDEYNDKYYNYVLIGSSDPNYNEKLKLYYKYSYDLTPSEDGSTSSYNSNLFIQNEITGGNAIFIVDDSLTSSDKATYKTLYYTSISSDEYRTNSEFYVQLTEKDIEKYGDKGRYSTLYYKYKNSTAAQEGTPNYKIYEYTTSTNSTYNTFYDTDADYVASDYELIKQGDPNYVEGKKLYYKKIRTERYIGGESDRKYTPTTYYYQSSSNVSIKANSYYALSFYMYTNGYVYNASEKDTPLADREKLPVTGEDASNEISASVYFSDTSGTIQDIKFENISTHGEWKQYYAFVATDAISSSTLRLSIYLGSKAGIAGANQTDELIVNGMVLVDDIKIVLINETDFNKHSIDDVSVIYTPSEEEEAPEDSTEQTTPPAEETEPKYESADKYGNEIIIKDYFNNLRNDSVVNGWSDMFDFDSHADYFMTEEQEETPAESKLQEAFDAYFDHFADDKIASSKYGIFSEDLELGDYTDSLLWHYYISRSNFGDKDYQKFQVYREAYAAGKLSASVIDEPNALDKAPRGDDEEDEEEEEENQDNNNDEDEEEEEEKDVPLIDSTFRENNKVLMLKNTDRQRALGIVSRPFTIKQNEYYKISIWIYSPDKDAKSTLNLESIQKTQNTPTEGTLLSISANVNARLKDYTTTPTNEYGWINISFFVEGNAYGDQDVFLSLMADANETIYFDNISIQRVTSSFYSNASSDSDNTTYCLSLAPSTSLITAGVTNGYFNSINVTDNFGDIVDGENSDIDYSKPRTAKNWTVVSTNSSEVVAGVIPTSEEYLALENLGVEDKTFYQKYNNSKKPFDNSIKRYANNLFAINAPTKIGSGIKDNDTKYTVDKNNYKIYSSSISMSANKTFELSFEFYAGYKFKGNMVANIYSGSVDASKKLASFKVPYDTTSTENGKWDKYTFFVQSGITSNSVYIEIGIEDATGTCFFQKVTNISSNYASVDAARDALIDLTNPEANIFENASSSNYRFVNMANSSLSVHSESKNENGTYDPMEYTSSQDNSTKNTVGKSGVAVASFYDKSTKIEYYTVTIDKVTYYIKGEEVTDADENTTTVYKLYTDSVFKNEITEINGKTFTIEPGSSGKTLKVLVGNSKTSYDGASVEKTTYNYKFTDDVVIGDNFISASELDNNVSQNVMILSNSLTTDYTLYTPVYTKTLSTTAYYVLKIYVKTSAITSSKTDEESGLNITISSISTSWTNIDTTKLEKSTEETDENNGFVCYQVLISTNTSSVASFGVQFSLGSEENQCSGYAIIAGVTLESFGSETLFNEYASTIDDDDTTVKRFYGKTSEEKDDTEEPEEEPSTTWATFFYIFSSLLLGIVLIIALVAVVVKKHPIKIGKGSSADNILITPEPQSNKPKRKSKTTLPEQDLETEESDDMSESSDNGDEGFV